MTDTAEVDDVTEDVAERNARFWDSMQSYIRKQQIQHWAALNEINDAPARRKIEQNLDLTPAQAYAEAVALICPPPPVEEGAAHLSALIAEGVLVDVTDMLAVQDACASDSLRSLSPQQRIAIGASMMADIQAIPAARAQVESVDARLYDALVMADRADSEVIAVRYSEVGGVEVTTYQMAITTDAYAPASPASTQYDVSLVTASEGDDAILILMRADDADTLSRIAAVYG